MATESEAALTPEPAPNTKIQRVAGHLRHPVVQFLVREDENVEKSDQDVLSLYIDGHRISEVTRAEAVSAYVSYNGIGLTEIDFFHEPFGNPFLLQQAESVNVRIEVRYAGRGSRHSYAMPNIFARVRTNIGKLDNTTLTQYIIGRGANYYSDIVDGKHVERRYPLMAVMKVELKDGRMTFADLGAALIGSGLERALFKVTRPGDYVTINLPKDDAEFILQGANLCKYEIYPSYIEIACFDTAEEVAKAICDLAYTIHTLQRADQFDASKETIQVRIGIGMRMCVREKCNVTL